MHRFIDGEDRMQQALLPHSLEDYVGEENPVRVIEVFIDELDLAGLSFSRMTPAATGRPAYRPSTLLKIYLYGYLNRIQSSRRLEREAQRLRLRGPCGAKDEFLLAAVAQNLRKLAKLGGGSMASVPLAA